jgi:hypothetical protein
MNPDAMDSCVPVHCNWHASPAITGLVLMLGIHVLQTGNINKSLLTLGSCIRSLAEVGAGAVMIPGHLCCVACI